MERYDTGTIRLSRGAPRGTAWVTRPGTGMLNSHAERWVADPTRPEEEDQTYLRRSRRWSPHTGLPDAQSHGTGVGKSAEAVVFRAENGCRTRDTLKG